MNKLRQDLIKEARIKYGEITPRGFCKTFDECFTIKNTGINKYLTFEFNYMKDNDPGWTGAVGRKLEE